MSGQIAVELLRERLRCDPEAGRLVWRERNASSFNGGHGEKTAKWWLARYAGKEAFTHVDAEGYCVGLFDKRKLKAHRVIFAIVHGYWPTEIDHINGDRADNRISNLREVTRTENCRNRARGPLNKTGEVGVIYNAGRCKWIAHIGVGGRRTKTIGYFSTKEAAVTARKAAERELGFHKNHGRAA